MNYSDIPLFKEISEADIQNIVVIAKTEKRGKGEVIFAEDDAGEALYIVTAGAVIAVKEIDREKGLEKQIGTIGPGNFFGEMALMDGRPRSATIRAASDVELLKIHREDFNQLLLKNTLVASRLLFAIINEVSNRLRESNTELVTLYDTGKIMASSQSMDEMCMAILERAIASVEAKYGLIAVVNDITGTLEIKAQMGYTRPVNIDMEKSVVRIIYETGKNLHVNDFPNEPVAKEVELCGCENVSLVGIPLKKNKDVKGVIVLADEKKASFSARKFIMIKAVATQLATAVENTMLYQEKADREKLGRQYVSF